MGKERGGAGRVTILIELVLCGLLVAAAIVFALWKMDYLSPSTASHVRMTDQSRTAYVAKNLVEGRGYTANDLPANLLDFYDERGKLQREHWPNADRFPFAAYAIAGLYLVTGSTSPAVGIIVYNAFWLVAFMMLLYWLARTIWNDRYAPVVAVSLAMLHPMTFWYGTVKDSDMLFLMTACLACLYHWAQAPQRRMSWRLAIATGSFLAWLFLSRPNLGGAMILFFGVVALLRVRAAHGLRAPRAALVDLFRHEGVALLVLVVWCLPFAVHSWLVWGSPFFSANGIYQLPLGTSFGMGTDTWWKYSDPDHPVTLGRIVSEVPGELISKFTSSWAATFKAILSSFAMELLLAAGALAWLASRRQPSADEATPVAPTEPGAPAAVPPWSAVTLLGGATATTFLINLAVLPLYGYQNYSYRSYLGFVLPLVWILAGYGVTLLFRYTWPQLTGGAGRLRSNLGIVLLAVVALVVVWNLGERSIDGNTLFGATTKFAARHWLIAPLALFAVLAYGFRWRRLGLPVLVAFIAVVVMVRFQPSREIKFWNFMFLSASEDDLAEVLRERKGIVSSFALQSEVAWLSGRKNVPASEYVMHLYSYLFDHGVEVEDLYIESAETLTSPRGGPFADGAPGFEGYARLQQLEGKVPGYEKVFHQRVITGYPKFNVTPRPKASTVYRLTDREAVQRMRLSPDRLDLGSPETIVHTAHGFGDYYVLDGKNVVPATDVTANRYVKSADKPWESSAVTFFIDDARTPTSVELEIYATHAETLQFYWNLDLYRYDSPASRNQHRLGIIEIKRSGWYRVSLDVPPELVRVGLNKLGFRAVVFQPVIACPADFAEASCMRLRPSDEQDLQLPTRILEVPAETEARFMRVSLFASTLTFRYGDGGPEGLTALPPPPGARTGGRSGLAPAKASPPVVPAGSTSGSDDAVSDDDRSSADRDPADTARTPPSGAAQRQRAVPDAAGELP